MNGEQPDVATVLGYHGCQKEFAGGVRSGQITFAQWKPSQNQYDWLGEGIYFWEGSRTRAEQWAALQYGDEADVLAGQRLPVCEVREGRLPGRAMPVALQTPPLPP